MQAFCVMMIFMHNWSLSNTVFCMDNICRLNMGCQKFLVTNDSQNNINSKYGTDCLYTKQSCRKKCQCMIIAKLQSIYLPVINLFPWDLTLEQLASKLYWCDTLGKAVRDNNSYNWIFYSIMNTFLCVRFVYIFSGMQWCTLYSGSWLMPGQDSSVGVPSSLPLVKECLIATGT